MDMNDYQEAARKTAIYPASKALEYTALGLAGEAGEYANKVKKVLRDGMQAYDVEAFAAELGDVLWYVSQCAEELGVYLDAIALHNLKKLSDRKEADTLSGKGDDR